MTGGYRITGASGITGGYSYAGFRGPFLGAGLKYEHPVKIMGFPGFWIIRGSVSGTIARYFNTGNQFFFPSAEAEGSFRLK